MLNIRLDHEEARFSLGERVAGEIEWRLDGRPRVIRLLLYWQTAGKAAAQDQEVIQHLDLSTPGVAGRHPFSFRLPRGPCSFEGAAIRVRWCLEATAEGAGNETCVREIEMSHLRRIVRRRRRM